MSIAYSIAFVLNAMGRGNVVVGVLVLVAMVLLVWERYSGSPPQVEVDETPLRLRPRSRELRKPTKPPKPPKLNELQQQSRERNRRHRRGNRAEPPRGVLGERDAAARATGAIRDPPVRGSLRQAARAAVMTTAPTGSPTTSVPTTTAFLRTRDAWRRARAAMSPAEKAARDERVRALFRDIAAKVPRKTADWREAARIPTETRVSTVTLVPTKTRGTQRPRTKSEEAAMRKARVRSHAAEKFRHKSVRALQKRLASEDDPERKEVLERLLNQARRARFNDHPTSAAEQRVKAAKESERLRRRMKQQASRDAKQKTSAPAATAAPTPANGTVAAAQVPPRDAKQRVEAAKEAERARRRKKQQQKPSGAAKIKLPLARPQRL